jgi:hypothetical protein
MNKRRRLGKDAEDLYPTPARPAITFPHQPPRSVLDVLMQSNVVQADPRVASARYFCAEWDFIVIEEDEKTGDMIGYLDDRTGRGGRQVYCFSPASFQNWCKQNGFVVQRDCTTNVF